MRSEYIQEILQRALNYIKEKGKIPSRQQIANDLSISEGLAKNIRFMLEYGNTEIKSKDIKITKTAEGPNLDIVSTSAEIRTLDQLLKFCKVDLTEWQVNKHVVNSWGSLENENFQVKAWLSRKNNSDLSIEEQAEQFKKFVELYKPEYNYLKPREGNIDGNMLEISLPDFHYGQLSWKEEVGENYDIKIAAKLWLDAIKYFAEVGRRGKISKFLFPIGHDFFNVNSALNTTFAGTPQTEDERWQKTFSTGWRLVVQGLDILLSVADVDVYIVPGNHDTERAYYMGEVINSWYRNCEYIKIDNRPIVRKYHKYGKNLIGMGHCKDEKLQELPIIMALEAKEYFSECEHFEFHAGHLHHDKRLAVDLVDNKSIKIRIMPSLVPLSIYSKNHAYMSVREGIGLLWDKEKGKIAEFSYYPEKIEEVK